MEEPVIQDHLASCTTSLKYSTSGRRPTFSEDKHTGVYDSFYDDDSECPKCHAKITSGWQTKRLESLLDSWRKGDFVQYHTFEVIPEEEREKRYGDRQFRPSIRRTEAYESDAPLFFNAKVPVHTFCDKCNA